MTDDTIVDQLAQLSERFEAQAAELVAAKAEIEIAKTHAAAMTDSNAALVAERDKLTVRATEAEVKVSELSETMQTAQIEIERLEQIAALEAYQHVTPGATPVGDSPAPEASDIWTQYSACKTAAEKTNFWRTNSAALKNAAKNR